MKIIITLFCLILVACGTSPGGEKKSESSEALNIQINAGDFYCPNGYVENRIMVDEEEAGEVVNELEDQAVMLGVPGPQIEGDIIQPGPIWPLQRSIVINFCSPVESTQLGGE